jgi:hypothetical protein
MIEDKDLGLKIAENPREALIKTTIDNTKSRILQLELTLDLEREALKYLESQISKSL